MTTHVSELPRLWSMRQTLADAISTANGDPHQSREVVATEIQDARTNCAAPAPPPLLTGGRAGPPPSAIGEPPAKGAAARQTKACGLPIGSKSTRADPLCCGWMHHMSTLDARITQFGSQAAPTSAQPGSSRRSSLAPVCGRRDMTSSAPSKRPTPRKNAVVLHQRTVHHSRRRSRGNCGRRAVRAARNEAPSTPPTMRLEPSSGH